MVSTRAKQLPKGGTAPSEPEPATKQASERSVRKVAACSSCAVLMVAQKAAAKSAQGDQAPQDLGAQPPPEVRRVLARFEGAQASQAAPVPAKKPPPKAAAPKSKVSACACQ
jgi:hypothetical protein